MKVKITTTPITEVTHDLQMTMSEREIRALLTVVRNVGGLPEGPRGALNELYNALYRAVGITQGHLAKASGSIIFPDTWAEFEEGTK